MSDLHYQAQHGTADEVARLLDKHDNEVPLEVDRRDIHGFTPLHKAAAATKDPDIIRVLLEYGSDRKAKNSRGDTPLDLARENKKSENIALLLNYHPDAKKLHLASQVDRPALVRNERGIYINSEADRIERERSAKAEADRIESERNEKAKTDRMAEKEAARKDLEDANSMYGF